MKQEKSQYTTRILIVDDHQMTRDLVKSILRSQGFTNVIMAENGREALSTIMGEKIEFVVCDWNMPEMNGLQLLRALRKSTSKKTIPFLMLTAESYRENVMEAIKYGTTDYVTKPFTPQTLLEKVMRILNITD